MSTPLRESMKLWGTGTPRTIRPLWVAEELALDYTLVPMGPRTGETRTAEYTALAPKQKIPILTEGDLILSESLAICRYLIDQYNKEGVFYSPRTGIEAACLDEWCCYIYGEIDETSLYVVRRHDDLREIYGEAPNAITSSLVYAKRHLDVVDQRLRDRRMLLGEQISVADILLVTCLDWALHCGIELTPHLAEYRDRLAERPAYQRAREMNFS